MEDANNAPAILNVPVAITLPPKNAEPCTAKSEPGVDVPIPIFPPLVTRIFSVLPIPVKNAISLLLVVCKLSWPVFVSVPYPPFADVKSWRVLTSVLNFNIDEAEVIFSRFSKDITVAVF